MVTKLTALACLVAAAAVTAFAAVGHTISSQQKNATRVDWVASHGPGGGPALALAVAPSAPQTIYVGTPTGVFRSVDGGHSWVSAGLATRVRVLVPEGVRQGVTSLLVDPQAPATVYAGLNPHWEGVRMKYAEPVFKSTDGGRSWGPLPLRGQPIAISLTEPA